jgi:ribosomal protein L22
MSPQPKEPEETTPAGDASDAAPSPEPEAAAEPETTPAAPAAPKRARRSRARKTTEPEAEAEAKPKPARSRTRRKAAEPDEAAKPEKPAAAKPRTRRKAAEPEEPAPPEKPAAPAPTRRRAQREPGAPAPVVRAQARYVRSSARKARLVCDHIRGKSVDEARAILALTPRAIAEDWSKLLESAIANAEHNHELVGEDLYVKAVHADEGPTIKRFRPRAMGRATRIRKRTSHLTILLTPKD